jgi:hypothetical protein
MKNGFPAVLVLSLCVAFTGCGRKADAKTELERAATELAKPEPAPAATVSPAPTPQAAPIATPIATPIAAAEPSPLPSQQMNQAVAAYKAGNLEDAVTRLQKLRASPVMTPQQRMALNDAMGAVMSEIYALAEKGDGRAIAAVKQYEFMQTHR